jgi:hypothetical protein
MTVIGPGTSYGSPFSRIVTSGLDSRCGTLGVPVTGALWAAGKLEYNSGMRWVKI